MRGGAGLRVQLARRVRHVACEGSACALLACCAFSRALCLAAACVPRLAPCACRAVLPVRLPRPFPCITWLEYHGCAVLRATPGGIFDEEVTPMDAQTVIALCAIFTVVAAMIGLSKGK